MLWYNRNIETSVHNGNVFTLHQVSRSDQGYYECWGRTDKHENFRARALLDIKGETKKYFINLYFGKICLCIILKKTKICLYNVT